MIKTALLQGWTFMRWLRLAIVIAMLIQTYISHDGFYAVIAIFFLFQVFSNQGFCGNSSCSIPVNKTKSDSHN